MLWRRCMYIGAVACLFKLTVVSEQLQMQDCIGSFVLQKSLKNYLPNVHLKTMTRILEQILQGLCINSKNSFKLADGIKSDIIVEDPLPGFFPRFSTSGLTE
jgi:hypothetical protein